MVIFEPTHTEYQGRVITTVTSSGSANGYPVVHETRLLGIYPNQASAEAAWDAWTDAQEGSRAPLDQPWKGIALPEVPRVDGGLLSIVAAALKSEDVVLVSSNGSDFFADTEANVVADVQKNFRNYNGEWDSAPEDWQDAFAATASADYKLVRAIREGFTPAHRIAAVTGLPLADIQKWWRSEARGDRALSPTGQAIRQALGLPEHEATGTALVQQGIITTAEADEAEIGE